MAVRPGPDAYRSTALVVSAGLTVDQARRISGNAAVSARLSRIMRAASRRIALGIQAVSPVKTGLFRRRWKAELVSKTRVELSNNVRYAQYVHPKGTPRSRTVANVDAPRIIRETQRWLDAEVEAQLGEAFATILIAETIDPPTTAAAKARYNEAKRVFDDWIASVTRNNAVPGARVLL